jgi:hypothetical protein
MRKNLMENDSGVNMIIEYIMTFIIASILFSIVLLMANGLFIDGPQKTVSRVQFTDIGNDITAKMVDTYLIAPQNGYISTTFDMPLTVAGKSYMANVRTSANSEDKEVIVYSLENGVSITTTLNGVNSTIPVSGNTSSLAYAHYINYSNTE